MTMVNDLCSQKFFSTQNSFRCGNAKDAIKYWILNLKKYFTSHINNQNLLLSIVFFDNTLPQNNEEMVDNERDDFA